MISSDILHANISDTQGEDLTIYGVNVEGSNNNLPTVEAPEYQLTADKLAQWLTELRNQPRFRKVMDLEAGYADGNQIDADTMKALNERGQAPVIDNQIGSLLRAITGMQKKTRQDTAVKPEAGETNSEVAEALSCELKEYSKMCESDKAKSEAYKEFISVGVSHLEVSTNDDPFGTDFIYSHVHRRECYWDWRAKPDYSNARYFIRRKWIDEDQLILTFPEQKEFIESALGSRSSWDMELMTNQLTSRGNAHQTTDGFDVTVEQYEWMNIQRKRLLTYEVWYRVKIRDLIFKLPNGKIIEYDKTNATHFMLSNAGIIKPYEANFDRIRVSFWIGPQRVGDYASPYKHKHFPYIPMFCFREDRTNIPYGLIRTMMSPQDEINARKTKMLWLLNARWVEATANSVDDHAVAAQEVARPDGYVITNNKPGEKFEVHDNQQITAQQFQVMIEAKETLQTNAGVHTATLGQDSKATSGLAINSLVEQDSITLAEPNDNFNMACRRADGIFLELIMDKLANKKDHSVTVEDDLGQKKVVVLNQQGIDPQTGLPTILNDLSKVNVAVVLADTPQTPTFRNQQLLQITEMVKGLPEAMQAQLAPDLIMATDNPHRKEMAAKIIKLLGQNGEQDPEKEQLKQQVQELTQKLQAKQPQEITNAMVLKLMAEVDNLKANAAATNVKAMYSSVQAAASLVQNPAEVPVSDALLASAGFVDHDKGGITNNQVIQQQPQQGQVRQNTNPMYPPDPQQPQSPDTQQMQQPSPPQSPDIGADKGIETQSLTD